MMKKNLLFLALGMFLIAVLNFLIGLADWKWATPIFLLIFFVVIAIAVMVFGLVKRGK
jgi:cell division protein FtsW (lipid II flippase)